MAADAADGTEVHAPAPPLRATSEMMKRWRKRLRRRVPLPEHLDDAEQENIAAEVGYDEWIRPS